MYHGGHCSYSESRATVLLLSGVHCQKYTQRLCIDKANGMHMGVMTFQNPVKMSTYAYHLHHNDVRKNAVTWTMAMVGG